MAIRKGEDLAPVRMSISSIGIDKCYMQRGPSLVVFGIDVDTGSMQNSDNVKKPSI